MLRLDREIPIVVFLGPTMSVPEAQSVLEANYLEPAQMGDIYRLTALGLRVIVLIDGIFHYRPAIWQREILEAIDEGITVVGASSMGALRAAELCDLGMLGHGTIFEWYKDGVIDGDDEVALLHSDRSDSYRSLSQPLVDLRYNMTRAVEAGVLGAEPARRIVGALKNRFFGERSYEALLAEAERQLGPSTRTALQTFLGRDPPSLKRRDALGALELARQLLADDEEKTRGPGITTSSIEPPTSSRASAVFRPYSAAKRGLYDERTGEVVTLERRLDSVAADDPEIVELATEAARRFFLRLWAESARIVCPRPFVRDFENSLSASLGCALDETWRARVGLSPSEFHEEIEQRAIEAWILQKAPEAFGLPPAAGLLDLADSLARARIAEGTRDRRAEEVLLERYRRHGATARFIQAWASASGVKAPPEEAERLRARVGQSESAARTALVEDMATYSWILRQGPRFFGYVFWSEDLALANELRFADPGGVLEGHARLAP